MPVIKYDFLPDLTVDPETKKLGTIYRPYIPIKIGNKNKWSPNFIKSLIDSGADHNVFPSSFASEIGINYTKGQYRQIIGVGNLPIDSFINFVKVKIENKVIETVIQFGEQVKTPLLGREGFFNYFDYIKFNAKRRFLEIKY